MAQIFYITLLVGLVFVFCYAEVLSKHNLGVVGGWTQQPLDSVETKNFTHFAVNKYNQRSNHINYKTLIEIKESRSQVVAGVKYFITFVIGETDCRKNGNQVTDVDKCEVVKTSV